MEPENNINLEGMFDVWATQCLNPCTFSISFSDLAAREKKVCIFSGKIPNSKHCHLQHENILLRDRYAAMTLRVH